MKVLYCASILDCQSPKLFITEKLLQALVKQYPCLSNKN